MIIPAFATSPLAVPGVRMPSPRLVVATAVSLKVAALEKEGAATGVAQPARGGPGACDGVPTSVAEWDVLFDAVVKRLRKAALEPESDQWPTSPRRMGGPSTLAAVVLECADAMGSLRTLREQQRK